MFRRFALASLIAVVAALGCHAQVPPSGHAGIVSWSVPAANSTWAGCGSGQPACTYIISALKVAATASSCPNSTGSNYTPLNQAQPATGTSYTDVADNGSTVCYVAQTVQGTGISTASAPTVTPVTIPGNPTAPSVTSQSAKAETEPPLMSQPSSDLAMNVPLGIRSASR